MNKPEMKFLAGGISASIWKNKRVFDGKEVETKSVTFQKTYKDKEGNWQTTQNLSTRDLPNAMVVLGKAYEHLALKQKNPQEA